MTWIRPAFRILCLCFIISVIVLHECEARGGRGGGGRGGGRFGGRFSRSGYRSGYRSSSYRSGSRLSRSFRSSTLRRGTSPYTRSNWKYYAGIGMIYGSSRYMRSRRYHSHPDEMPTVCNNRYERTPNGSVYGYFICPKDGDNEDMEYCCGSDGRETCCRFGDSPGRIAGIVCGVLVAVVVVGLCVYCCCCRKSSSGGTVIQRMSTRRKDTSYPHVYTSVQTGQVTTGYPAHTDQPPPANMAGAGYDSNKGGLPYNPNPGQNQTEWGQQPPQGPPGYPYPPDDKGPLPQGDVSSNGPGGFTTPYPPPSGGAPYPPPHDGAPYPPPQGGAPFPPPQGGAPYPPANGGPPYPPPDGNAPHGAPPPGFVYPLDPNGPQGGPYPNQPPPPYMQ